ncbi:hypothetical protein EDC01DRAFT_38403 [Geopyxis carbonaria]|nr:hypothetical protein EDC01DRAFT_38403 [Geopyxis carbonaria]
MPSRLPISLSSLRITPTAQRTFSSTPLTSSQAYKPKRKTFNPHAAAISKKQREANVARQAVLQEERKAAAVDPVMGRTTAFVQTVDAFPQPPPPLDVARAEPDRLNHFIDAQELPNFIAQSRDLSAPRAPPNDPAGVNHDVARAFEDKHERAVEAIRRIIALGNGSSADKTRSNKQMCIDMFGRHNTDGTLPKDPGAPDVSTKTPRAGPDTGSSEVQAAILTVKIRALRNGMESMNALNKDKHNKRNLRLMVHRRQKLLTYLKRKEKGGIRWRNIMDALGLDNDAIEKELFL